VKKPRWRTFPAKVSEVGHDLEGAQQFEQDRVAAGHKRMSLNRIAN
jgi:hypothetical protein